MISFQPQPFSGAGGWPVCPWGWAMPAGSLGTSNQHLHKLNQVKVNHSSTMAASPAVALQWAHLSPGSPSSSHKSLPHTQTGHWSWLFPHLSRNLRMGRRHWGHTSHWSSSPRIFLLCVGHSAWLLSLKATPTPPTVKFFTNCTPSAWHGDAAGVCLIWHKDRGEAGACQLWNIMVYFELSMLLWYIISFSGSQMLRQRNSQDLQKPLKKGFRCFKS